MERKKYPIRAEDYELYETVGQGVSASVYRALCIPFEEVVAIKILDFERNNSDLNNISREAQTMILIDHPNVLRAYCSFVNDHDLWVVMPYMSGGSCLHILKSAYPNGFEEVVIATVLKEILKGLEYLHHHGHIHRDIKAGNILVDSRGGIKLGDYGVSACLFDSGDRQRTRNTFVGTPCWMAPEVMEQLNGYNFKADIWSFGITALELAHGHAPFSKYPPMKVLLMTLQNAPPSLDYDRDRKFSRSFRQVVSMCLVKDPSKRPTAQKLLKQPFFKQARSQDYMVRKILDGLPSLGVRHQALKDKEEDLLAQKKMPDAKKEELSQNEYNRGISSWNFDIEDLKAQASLNEDNKDSESCKNSLFEITNLHERMTEGIPISGNDDDLEDTSPHKATIFSSDRTIRQHSIKNDASDNEFKDYATTDQNALQSGSPFQYNEMENSFKEFFEIDGEEKKLNNVVNSLHDRRPSTSSSNPLEFLQASKGESSKTQIQQQNMGNNNEGGADINNEAIFKPSKAVVGDDLDDKSKPPLVQQKGRFKVTSESVDFDKGLPPISLQKSHSMQVISQLSSPSMTPPSDVTPSIFGGSLLAQLHAILQTNIIQRDNILSMMRQLSTGDPFPILSSTNRANDILSFSQPNIAMEKILLECAHEREKELIQEVAELQWRLVCVQEEVQRVKSRNAQV